MPTPAPTQTVQASDGTQLDPSVVNLAKAIRTQESGNNYTRSGDAGTSTGAYQFNNGGAPVPKGGIPANYKTWATQYGVDPNDFSPVNQDKVAYARISDLKQQGLSPAQIAAAWNAGEGHVNDWQTHKGTTTINGQTISYDTPAYVDKVINTFRALKSGQQPLDGGQNGSGGATGGGTAPQSSSVFGGIANGIGGFLKSIVQAPVTMLARPLQAAAELGGASPEDVNAFSSKVPIFGAGGALDVPRNMSDVSKDVGRGVETAALGLAPVAGGAAFGLGSSMEQGNSPLSLNAAAQTALGAAGGKILDFAAPYIAKGASAAMPQFVKNAFGAVAEKAAPVSDAVGRFMDETKILPDALSGAINRGADAVNAAPSAFAEKVKGQYGLGTGGTADEVRQRTLADVTKALGSTGTKSAGVFSDVSEKQLRGLETLHDLSPGLRVTDEFGDAIPYDPTTATLPQHVEALAQAKTNIYKEIEKNLATATKGGVQVDTSAAEEYLKGILADRGATLKHARAASLLEKVQGLNSPTEVNSFLQDLNSGLSGFFAGGQSSIERKVDAGLTQQLNGALDRTVVDLETGAKPIRDLKAQYSSLKSIEKGMVNKAQQLARKVGGGLGDYINPFNLADALTFMHSPWTAAKGVFRAAALEKMKLTRDPERLLNGVFKNIAQYKGAAPVARTVFGRPSAIPAVVGGGLKAAFGAFSPQSTEGQ